MSQRTRDNGGETKDLKGAKTCDRGHVVCKGCLWKNAEFFSRLMRHCPICEKQLQS